MLDGILRSVPFIYPILPRRGNRVQSGNPVTAFLDPVGRDDLPAPLQPAGWLGAEPARPGFDALRIAADGSGHASMMARVLGNRQNP